MTDHTNMDGIKRIRFTSADDMVNKIISYLNNQHWKFNFDNLDRLGIIHVYEEYTRINGVQYNQSVYYIPEELVVKLTLGFKEDGDGIQYDQ